MNHFILNTLMQHGLSDNEANTLISQIDTYLKTKSPEECWRILTQDLHITKYAFNIYKLLYEYVYPDWYKIPAPVWFPDERIINTTNVAKLMQEQGFSTYQELHTWSVSNYADFWHKMTNLLDIKFDKPYSDIVNLSEGLESPAWFPKSKLNITNSCFNADENKIAIIEQTETGNTIQTTYQQLNNLANRIAHSLNNYLSKEDRVAIVMPMTTLAVAIYLGILKSGRCVVSIPDSFSADEIDKRLSISNVKAVFSQFQTIRDGKIFPLYEKLIAAKAPLTILVDENNESINLQKQDVSWSTFLDNDDSNISKSCDPNSYINIIYSSGTTATPKAIPWDHTTPIKCATDAYLHLNIQANDILCWPTSLGWMMGPWLVFASLINKATMALYTGNPNGTHFGKFIENNKITFLGVVPTQVKSWRHSGCMEGLNWDAIKAFGTTGECSNIEDMLYLMSLAHYKPVIEYCGGTEVGGAYITSTLIHPNAPSALTTPALGIDFKMVDEEGLATTNHEAFLIPPSIGLSTTLLNKNHHEIYYSNLPNLLSKQLLRRHGDIVEKFENGFYRIRGRDDETMNLGGIKVSSVEIESTINLLSSIFESAAIGVEPDDGGPSQLVIFVVAKPGVKSDQNQLKTKMQSSIKKHLNPLFKIHDVVILDYLPKTASNKIMRRILKDQYLDIKATIQKPTGTQVSRKKICLALQGGGSYGAYTWGILDKLLEDDRIEIDAISSSSAGSINAAIMTQGMINGGTQGARDALADFWFTLSQHGAYLSPIREIIPLSGFQFHNDASAQTSFIMFDLVTRLFSPYILNPFNFNILRLILNEKIDFSQLRSYDKIKLFISTTNVKTGLLKVFENNDLSIDVILASACLPHLNHAVEINNEFYWDGGFLGNPTIYPLIYNSLVDDIIIVVNNPIAREEIPISSTDIASRVNEISFNSSLLRELRAIAFVTKLIDKGYISPEYSDTIRRKFVHIIRSDEVMNQFNIINKYNWHWDFLSHLRDIGRSTAENWLKLNFDHLGKKQTIDFKEFLDTNMQK